MDAETVFHACSITKLVTALLVMRLYEERKLDIDCDVDGYLKRWKIPYEKMVTPKVTLRHLLSHTSGIKDGENGFCGYRKRMNWISLETILSGNSFYNLPKAVVSDIPGSVFAYSDAGYCVLQMVIEDVLNVPFQEAAKEWIFDPLHMEHSFIAEKENLADYQKRFVLAVGYNEAGLPIEDRNVLCPDLAAAGLWTNPSDLVRLGEALYDSLHSGTGLLKKETAILLASPAFDFEWTGLGIFRESDTLLVSRGWGGGCPVYAENLYRYRIRGSHHGESGSGSGSEGNL